MVQKFPFKVGFVALLLGAFAWIWLANDSAEIKPTEELVEEQSQQLVSSIQPISNADAARTDSSAPVGVVSAALPPAGFSQDLDYKKADQRLLDRFRQANELAAAGQIDQAKTVLRGLIKEYPRVIEPYINLAAIYADAKQFDLASEALDQAMQANPNTATLFANVQKVYGAKAAQAYALALNEQETEPTELQLARITSLDTTAAQGDITEDLRQQLTALGQENDRILAQLREQEARAAQASTSTETAAQRLAEQSASVVSLRAEVSSAEQQIAALRSAHESEISQLRAQLAEQTQLAQAAAGRESKLLAQIDQQASEQEQARLRETQLALAQQEERDRLAREEAERRAAAIERTHREQELAAQNAASAKAQRDKVAADLVRSWAASWSSQNVAAYVSHYVDNYTPRGSSLSRAQWLEQRRVRLQNKKFIDVQVSDFMIRETGRQLAITFTQHYRSNTVDDRIRKRLVFQKNGEDLSQAKIVDEKVVST